METHVRISRLNTAIALFMAFVLALGLAPLPRANALSPATIELQASDMVTVALTVVDEMDSNHVVYNGKVAGLTADDTVADLLSAAGFTRVDSQGACEEWNQYWNGGGDEFPSPYFLGKGYDSSTQAYWETTFNSDSGEYANALLTKSLQDGGHYQYIYKTYGSTFDYTTAIPDPLATEVPARQQLINNLAARFSKGGADSSITNATYGAALALANLDKEDRIDIDALKQNADSAGVTSAGTMAKYVLALEAADADEATLASYVKKMEDLETGSEDFYSLVLILAAYNVTSADFGESAKYDEDDLVSALLKVQVTSGDKAGLFALFPADYSDPSSELTDAYANAQSTAEAIFALEPSQDSTDPEDEVAPALAKARAAAANLINADGTITPDRTWNQAKMDYDAMGELIDALVTYEGTLGIEAEKLVDALVAGADSTLDGFAADENNASEVTSAATAFRGLAAAWAADSNKIYLDNEVDARVDIAGATVAAVPAATYAGRAIMPSLSITYGERALTAGADYTVVWTSNENVGTARGVISGKGAFKGTKDVSFTIVTANVSQITAKSLSATYSGKVVNPVPSMKLNGKTLVKGTDFTVSYLNSKKKSIASSKVKAAGTYYVRVKGKGNFTGTKNVKLTVAKASIAKAKVAKIANKKRTGKAIKPVPKVTFGGKALAKGVDFTLKYSKNKKVGTAKVKISGKGNFKGSTTAKFKIVK